MEKGILGTEYVNTYKGVPPRVQSQEGRGPAERSGPHVILPRAQTDVEVRPVSETTIIELVYKRLKYLKLYKRKRSHS